MADCEERVRDENIVLKDHNSKSTARFINSRREEVLKVRIDHCLVAEETACDYLIQHSGTNYFVELKGQDIMHALNQIAVSIGKFNGNYGSCRCVAVISATRVPGIAGFQKAFKTVRKSHGSLSSNYHLSSSGKPISLS